MEDKELIEYKQKIKGLTLKELQDMLTHIQKDKTTDRYQAIAQEIELRTGVPVQQQEPPKFSVPIPRIEEEQIVPPPPSVKTVSAPAIAPAVVSEKPSSTGDRLANALIIFLALFDSAGIVACLILFFNLPGVLTLRSLLGQ